MLGLGGSAPFFSPLFTRVSGWLILRIQDTERKAGNWSDLGNRTGGYSSTNSSTGTPYALAIFVTVGI
jgi:hypothetical protein